MVRNLLTIRYNPTEKPIFQKALLNDFIPRNSDENGIFIEELLLKNIRHQFKNKSDPIIVSLSSGIDSSLCLALLRKCFPKKKIIALCGVFDKTMDESKEAKKIADHFSAKFKIVKMPSIFLTMPKLISITQKPKWNTYTHIIAQEAKKYGNDLVTGDGADEIFGGYTFRYSKYLNLFQSRNNWKTNIINYLDCHNRDWVSDQQQMFGSSIKFDWNVIYNYFKSYFNNSLTPLSQVLFADFNGKLLFDFIPTSISISKYYKIRNFSPFLDSNIIKFGLGLPIQQKYDLHSKKGKKILRKISKRLGIKHIEQKKGFSPGLWLDWEKNGKKLFESIIMTENANIFKKNFIEYNWVVNSFEKLTQDGDIRYLNRLISILTLEIWYKMIILNEFDHNHKF